MIWFIIGHVVAIQRLMGFTQRKRFKRETDVWSSNGTQREKLDEDDEDGEVGLFSQFKDKTERRKMRKSQTRIKHEMSETLKCLILGFLFCSFFSFNISGTLSLRHKHFDWRTQISHYYYWLLWIIYCIIYDASGASLCFCIFNKQNYKLRLIIKTDPEDPNQV